MADLAPMDQDEDMADGPPDDGVDILEEAAPDEDEELDFERKARATMNKLQWGRIRRLKSLNLPFVKRSLFREKMMEFISYTLASAHTSSIPGV